MSRAAPIEDEELRRLGEASAWRVALSEADAATSPEFEAWIAEPSNEAAWDQVQTSWIEIEDHAGEPELLMLRRDALDRAYRKGSSRWTGTWYAVAACLVLLIAAGAVFAISNWRTQQPIVFATALGERRVVTMTDGSRISLDAASEVQVRYTDETRTIELVSGQARFDVAHDVTRRFLVRARDQTIVATGTAFNVDLMGAHVLVTLIEGSVVVLNDQGSRDEIAAPQRSRGVALRAGQQLTAAPQAAPEIQTVSLDRTTAWERGQLVFEDETLASIADRMSRYSARPLTVEASAANLRVSGVFRAGDVATFVDTVTRYLPVRATAHDDGSVVLKSTS